MQAACCINDEDIGPTRHGCLDGVVDNSTRIRALILADDGNADALSPYLELLDSAGAEGIGGGKHNTMSAACQPVGQFGDAGGFAGSIDSNYQHNGERRFL